MVSQRVSVVQTFLDLIGETDPNHVMVAADAKSGRHLLHPECIIINPLWHPDRGIVQAGELTPDGLLHGRSGIDRDLAQVNSRWKCTVSDTALYDVGEFVLYRAVANVTSKVSGTTVAAPFVDLYWVEDGLITKIDMYLDTKAFYDQLS
jgi:hypothetical protein